MSESVHVAVVGRSYDVFIGSGVLDEVADWLSRSRPGARVAIVTDETVAQLYGSRLDISLARAGFPTLVLTVPPGEASKSWALAGELCEQLAAQRFDRGDLIVALGGGVVGDLAGFVSAVYLRGIDFVQVPTTLLAMVDSSVGGKTAVDLRAGKNLAGAFKQPLAVFADTDTLASLPEGEWLSGMGEVVKSAILDGEEFTAWLEANAAQVAMREPAVTHEVVSRCVRFKGEVVSADEREAGDRECLNYGHTLAHAIEVSLGYGVVSHGAAVAEGMRFAARVSAEVVGAPIEFVRRQDRLLESVGLRTLDQRVAPAVVVGSMHGDKKARKGTVRMVLSAAPGVWSCLPVEDAILEQHVQAWFDSGNRES